MCVLWIKIEVRSFLFVLFNYIYIWISWRKQRKWNESREPPKMTTLFDIFRQSLKLLQQTHTHNLIIIFVEWFIPIWEDDWFPSCIESNLLAAHPRSHFNSFHSFRSSPYNETANPYARGSKMKYNDTQKGSMNQQTLQNTKRLKSIV